jgi:hypothetical protein
VPGDDFGDGWDLQGDESFLDDELEFDDQDPDETDPGEDEMIEDDWGVDGVETLEADGLLDEEDEPEWPDAAPVGGGPVSGGGDGVHAGRAGGRGMGEERMSWSAWDVGTAFGLGGWLLDQHAEQVGRQVRAAVAASATAPDTDAGPRGAPHPPPSSGHRYGTDAGVHRVGDPLRPGWVYSELAGASSRGRDLLLQAEGDGPAGGRLVLLVSAIPGSTGPRLWVVAEQHPGGFTSSRLVPVFQADASGVFAVFATDHAAEAADAVIWACGRENVPVDHLRVVRRS